MDWDIGQALHRAKMTGKAPAVALVVGEKDARYLKRWNWWLKMLVSQCL
ncbi:MAG: hypothetical protein IBX45_12660 [Campylobacterales bacterium]|nr:hypothetical protein [Campylobacterales bacterium]